MSKVQNVKQITGNKMKTLILSLVTLFLVTSINSTTFAQPKQKFHKKMFKERMIEKLNLTKEQGDKISDLRSDHQKKMADFKAELEKAKIDMRDLRDNSDLSRAEMISAVEKVNNIKNKMALERTNHRMDVYELLNDEQKEIWREHEPFKDNMKMGFKKGDFGYGKHGRMRQRIFDND
jgi:Spy/CpxP family protein refolding chaperone